MPRQKRRDSRSEGGGQPGVEQRLDFGAAVARGEVREQQRLIPELLRPLGDLTQVHIAAMSRALDRDKLVALVEASDDGVRH